MLFVHASLAVHDIWVLSMHTSALHRLPHLTTAGRNNRASLEYLVVVVVVVVVVSKKFFVFFPTYSRRARTDRSVCVEESLFS